MEERRREAAAGAQERRGQEGRKGPGSVTHQACKAPLFTDAHEFVPCSLPCCPAAHAQPPLETSLQGRGQGLGRLPSTLPQLTLSAKDVCLGRPGGSLLPTSVWTRRKPRRGLWSCDSSKHVPPGQTPGPSPVGARRDLPAKPAPPRGCVAITGARRLHAEPGDDGCFAWSCTAGW